MKKEDYINEVTALIKNKTAKKGIKKELETRIDELYGIADFDSFEFYEVREADGETRIKIRIYDNNCEEYWLYCTNSILVYLSR